MYLSALILSALPLLAQAGNQHLKAFREPRAVQRRNGRQFNLIDKFKADNFFDGFNFFTAPDPTHGSVQFLSKSEAAKDNLAFVQKDGTVVLAVDDKTPLAPGQNRKSIRLESKKTYDNGLFIADFWSMPHGCSVWPAWWLVGPNWPSGGEIDILEGVNNQATNQYTLHTAEGCSLDPNPNPQQVKTRNSTTGAPQAFTSTVLSTKCGVSGASNIGCAFLDGDTRTYGHGFNMKGGGVYATLVDSTGVSIWFFTRSAIPADIDALNPDPSTWGVPAAFFSSSTCDPANFFHEMQMVLDTTLCGDWAGAVYNQMGCPGTCAEAVADPANFKFAKWNINYIAVYN